MHELSCMLYIPGFKPCKSDISKGRKYPSWIRGVSHKNKSFDIKFAFDSWSTLWGTQSSGRSPVSERNTFFIITI